MNFPSNLTVKILYFPDIGKNEILIRQYISYSEKPLIPLRGKQYTVLSKIWGRPWNLLGSLRYIQIKNEVPLVNTL
jgi:hypothetical protein